MVGGGGEAEGVAVWAKAAGVRIKNIVVRIKEIKSLTLNSSCLILIMADIF